MGRGSSELLPPSTQAPTHYRLGDSMSGWASAVLQEAGPDDLRVVGAAVGGFCATRRAKARPIPLAAPLMSTVRPSGQRALAPTRRREHRGAPGCVSRSSHSTGPIGCERAVHDRQLRGRGRRERRVRTASASPRGSVVSGIVRVSWNGFAAHRERPGERLRARLGRLFAAILCGRRCRRRC